MAIGAIHRVVEKLFLSSIALKYRGLKLYIQTNPRYSRSRLLFAHSQPKRGTSVTFHPQNKKSFAELLYKSIEQNARANEIFAEEYLKHRTIEKERQRTAPYKKGRVRAIHARFMQQQHNEATVLREKIIFARSAVRVSGFPFSGAFRVDTIRQTPIDDSDTSLTLLILSGTPLNSKREAVEGSIEIGVTFDTHITYIL
jgi:hypothetical protein